MTDDLDIPLRWALAGYGAGGRTFHRPLLTSTPGLRMVGVLTGSPDRRRQVQADLPGVGCVDELAELVALGADGVTITTPSGTHADLAHAALDLGLHVVVDKPFALDAASATAVAEHAAAAGLVAVPYQNRRWDSDLLTVRRLIDAGSLGAVHRFTSRIDRFAPVKASWHGGSAAQGGGTLLDLGPHLVDQALHLFGPVTTVHAELRMVRPGAGADDDIELHLAHAGGTRSTLAAGMASAAPGPRFLVHGDRAGFAIDGFDGQEDQLKAGESPASLGPAWGVEPPSAWGRLWDDAGARPVPSERGAWDTFYPAVVAAVRGLAPPPVGPWDAVATARVLDAARVSAAEQRVVAF